ncbi:phage holin, LLH family [Fructilactobacillus florum]|uniref:Holin n=1 Tax=Fructilactobacillus florum DSM 22689 = JCM 16035 TaxID=1423745 RepID=A0A0R2CU99_9LACO|nr:phage holin, LLH family [Fructilactobacillus florum]KRM91612.1 hypothetical protein FC87_GL000744 [Fructilactobacillus florum DSM 22689 = JCM 16035]
MNEIIKLIDPATALVIITAIIKLIAPTLKSIHLTNRQQALYNQAKAAVTFAAQQTGLDDDQRRRLAEQDLAHFATDHGIRVSETTIENVTEYAYQILKNSDSINISSYEPKDKLTGDASLPKMDDSTIKAIKDSEPAGTDKAQELAEQNKELDGGAK